MNEVRPTQLTTVVVTRSASSAGATKEAPSLPSGGKDLPVETDKPVDGVTKSESIVSKKDYDEIVSEQIQQAVSDINEYVQSVQRDIHFSIDEDSGKTIIRVRDQESGELIRQIPEDIFLNLAQKLKENQTLHLLDAHG